MHGKGKIISNKGNVLREGKWYHGQFEDGDDEDIKAEMD